jgi:hypothetical protein
MIIQTVSFGRSRFPKGTLRNARGMVSHPGADLEELMQRAIEVVFE